MEGNCIVPRVTVRQCLDASMLVHGEWLSRNLSYQPYIPLTFKT